jgi:hypothetical protein
VSGATRLSDACKESIGVGLRELLWKVNTRQPGIDAHCCAALALNAHIPLTETCCSPSFQCGPGDAAA